MRRTKEKDGMRMIQCSEQRNEMPYKDIGLRIRTLREANGYTRDALAAKIDISTKFLYEIEMGKKGFSAETLCKLAKTLSISCDYILTGNDGSLIPKKIVDIINCFNPCQMGRVEEVLRNIQEMCSSEKGMNA